MKLNLGCGFNKKEGFVNVDKFDTCNPDMVADMEVFPWPWDDNSVDEVLFDHSLEHMGQMTDVFLGIIKELYRVCKKDVVVQINVPHPKHDNFISDPTHVRIITPQTLKLFSKVHNKHCVSVGAQDTPLGLYLNVDFEVIDVKMFPVDTYLKLLHENIMSMPEFSEIIIERNNIIHSFNITMKVIK